MACLRFKNGIMCGFEPRYRLRLPDGGYIYMEWHHYLGPFFFKDKLQKREVVAWHNDPNILAALKWFQNRGHKA